MRASAVFHFSASCILLCVDVFARRGRVRGVDPGQPRVGGGGGREEGADGAEGAKRHMFWMIVAGQARK